MFRGSYLATVDEKGRVKIPAAFLEPLREHGSKLFVTSDNGETHAASHVPRVPAVSERVHQISGCETAAVLDRQALSDAATRVRGREEDPNDRRSCRA